MTELLKTESDKKVATRILGPIGRCLGSKSLYSWDHPDHPIVYNANVVTNHPGKIWHGDLDLTVDDFALKALSIELGRTVFVLREMDARFGTEDRPDVGKAVYFTDGKIAAGPEHAMRTTSGLLVLRPEFEHFKDYRNGVHLARPIVTRVEMPRLTLDDRKFRRFGFPKEGLKGFASRSKKKDPLIKFMEWVSTKVTRHLNIFLTPEDEFELEGMLRKWVVRFEEKHPLRVEQTISGAMFDVGPNTFPKDRCPSWARSGAFYYDTRGRDA